MGIIATNVEKVLGEPPPRVLKNISVNIRDVEFIARTGRSVSG